mmetsp:Transcript_47823/g.96482  ORF Transcript_47823/g.96482 Transcript_47823/m.96482 type:complete len:239 (+) Transcript_47823:56-772(+)
MCSLGPIRRRLDLAALLAHTCGAAVGHGHADGQHRRLHAAPTPTNLRGVHARRDGRDELGTGIHDVGALEKRLLDAHVPIVCQAAGAGEADGACGSHQRDVRHTGQHNGAHDPVVGVHPHGSWRNDRLREKATLGHTSHATNEGVVDLAPFEALLTVLAPSELLGLHHAALACALERAFLGLEAGKALFRLVLPRLLVCLLLLYRHILLGGNVLGRCHQGDLPIQDLQLLLVHCIGDA